MRMHTLKRWTAVGAGLAGLLAASVSSSPASAETVTRSGFLSITPGWTVATYDRNPVLLPFTVTAPCETTDYGSGVTSTSCDTVRVDLVHPSSPASVASDLVFPADNGTGTGAMTIYSYGLNGFGSHTVRATNYETAETVTATVMLKALTRIGITAARSKKAPTAATLRVRASLTAFDGYSFTALSSGWPVVLQRKVTGRWVTAKTGTTTGGTATWTLKVTGKASTWRVCHLGGPSSTASCSSARTL